MHPVAVGPKVKPDERFRLLESNLACLWDQVWWLSLPIYKRWFYKLQGFRPPVRRFYEGPKWQP